MEKHQDLIASLQIKEKTLDEAKEQTRQKIQYVSEYIREWLYVATNMEDINKVIFIDAMANAGIYKDGTLGTSIEVLLLFKDFAEQHKDKTFYLLINDNNKKRIDIQSKLVDYYMGPVKPINMIVKMKDKDVNDYLQDYTLFDSIIQCSKVMCVLFIDPYNFRTIKINRIQAFVSRYYCEVLYNVFTSDKVRNTSDQAIQECLGNIIIDDNHDIINEVAHALHVGYIKHSFSYSFHISNNTELYQIMFLTPNKRGLEKIKDALWKVFDGARYHRNTNITQEQMSIFSSKEMQSYALPVYAEDARSLLLRQFDGRHYTYNDIEIFLIENTMLKSTHIINNVIKPLIDIGRIIKEGTVSSRNYKKDTYTIIGDSSTKHV